VNASPSLDAVAALVPFLRARRDDPDDGDLVTAELIADPGLLAAAVASTAEARGSVDPVVLASLWWQGYAYRMAGTTLAAWVVAGSAPDPSASCGGGVGIARGRPASLVVGSTAEEVTDLTDLVDRLFTANLEPLDAALRARHHLGERLVWGNAAGSIASCLSAVATAEGAPAELHERVDEVVAALPHGLPGLGTWLQPDHHAYRRTTCCLWFKTTAADGAYCEDCSLLPLPAPPDPDPTP
jgi:ferric iron reductase protein FhuF